MQVSTKCSVALHCLVFIAVYGETAKVTSELLAKSAGCNAVTVRNLLGQLQKAGFISVARGTGGAKLERAPEQITLWDVYAALEADCMEDLIGIHRNPSCECPVGCRICPVLKGAYAKVSDAMRKAMEQITLAGLLEDFRNTPGDAPPRQAGDSR